MKKLSKAQVRQLILPNLLFLVVFGLWQAYFLVSVIFPQTPVLYIYVLYFIINLADLASFLIFVKVGKSKLSEHGFKKPTDTKLCLTLSIFALVFFLSIMFISGIIWGYSLQPFPHTFIYFVFGVLNVIIVSLTTESIFRGFIFKNMVGKLGFYTSLYASSIMFSLNQIPILTLTRISANDIITYMLTDILPLFAAGLFLGFFFYKTGWSLIGPIIFRAGILFYYFFSPLIANPPWWLKLTFELAAYAFLISLLEATVRDTKFIRNDRHLYSG